MKTFKQFILESKKSGFSFDQLNQVFKHFEGTVDIQKVKGQYILTILDNKLFKDRDDLIELIDDYTDDTVNVKATIGAKKVKVEWNPKIPNSAEVVYPFSEIRAMSKLELSQLYSDLSTNEKFAGESESLSRMAFRGGSVAVICRLLDGPNKGALVIGSSSGIPKYLEDYQKGDKIFARFVLGGLANFTRIRRV